jgi:hypothetical protein
MKSFLRLFSIFFLLSFVPFPCLPEGGRSIDTSRGPVKVSIPTGMTAEDAFYVMCQNYWEERYDLEDALKAISDLNSAIDTYKKAVSDHEIAMDKLIKLSNVPKFGFTFGAAYGLKDLFPEITLGGSLLIKRWMVVNLSLNTSLRLGADLSILF